MVYALEEQVVFVAKLSVETVTADTCGRYQIGHRRIFVSLLPKEMHGPVEGFMRFKFAWSCHFSSFQNAYSEIYVKENDLSRGNGRFVARVYF
jgi:hypothetical protein